MHNEHGCEWDASACSEAAKRGHLYCLMYLQQHGYEWDETACSAAAAGGCLECLEYAHVEGCAWDTMSISMLPIAQNPL